MRANPGADHVVEEEHKSVSPQICYSIHGWGSDSTEYRSDSGEHKVRSAATRLICNFPKGRAQCATSLLEYPCLNVVWHICADDVTRAGWTDHPASKLMAAFHGITLEVLGGRGG